MNPRSFSNELQTEQIHSEIKGFFKAAGEENCELHVSVFPRSAFGFIRTLAKSLPDDTTLRVYAVGGEGTLFDCVNGVMGLKNVELAIVPYGRTDNFVRGFGADKISRFRGLGFRQFIAPVIPIDVIRCGANYALSSCVIGIEADAARFSMRVYRNLQKGEFLSRLIGIHFNTLFHFLGRVSARMDKKRLNQQYSISIDGKPYNGVYQNIVVLNGKYYGNGLVPLESTMPNDGLLDVFLEKSRGFSRVFKVFFYNITGRSHELPHMTIFKRGQIIHINSGEPLHISLDGEPFFDNQFTIEILPGALQFVNTGFDEASIEGGYNK